jgi:hypothetical protein
VVLSFELNLLSFVAEDAWPKKDAQLGPPASA